MKAARECAYLPLTAAWLSSLRRVSALRRLLPSAIVLALALTAAPSASAAVSWKPCKKAAPWQCATVPVPLDHANPGAGQLQLSLRRLLTHRTQKPRKTATVVLVGGPGGATTPAISVASAPARPGADVLLVDLRGTGGSGALDCQFSAAGDFAAEARACWEQLGDSRSKYTSAASVADLEAVRIATGYRKLDLHATSYGTKVAYDFAATYPASTGTLLLDSVVAPEGMDAWWSTSLRAVPRVLTSLCGGRRCSDVTKDVHAELAAVTQASRTGLNATSVDRTGQPVPRTISEADLLAVLLAGDMDSTFHLEIPRALTAARAGDPAALARLTSVAGNVEGGDVPAEIFSPAAYLATFCEETSFPWAASQTLEQRRATVATAAAARDAGSWGPFSPAVTSELPLEACIGWPTAGFREIPVRAPLPKVRTLILSGGLDLRTPLEEARAVAAKIPGAALVSVAGTGHSVFDAPGGSGGPGCGIDRWVAWVEKKQVRPTCSNNSKGSRVLPIAPTSLDQLAEQLTSGQRGRTVAAVNETIWDAFGSVVWAAGDSQGQIGGLRGGTVRLSRSGLALKNFEYVPGVRVSGRISFAGKRTTLKVGGPEASAGSVKLNRDLEITGGRLGGKKL